MGQVIRFLNAQPPQSARGMGQLAGASVHTASVRILEIQEPCQLADGRIGRLLQIGNWKRSGTVIAYEPTDIHAYTGVPLQTYTCIEGRFCWTVGNGQHSVLLSSREIPPEDQGPALIPASWAANPGDLAALVALVDNLQTPALKEFMNQALSEPKLAHAFVNIPASQKHHHVFPGGNLKHSLEVAFAAVNLLGLGTKEEFDLLHCAGVLHDIGRTEVYDAQGNYKPLGRLKHHDALTAEVLSAPMKALANKNFHLANQLRHLLYRSHKDRDYPQSTLYGTLLRADAQSVQQDAKVQAVTYRSSCYQQVQGDDGGWWIQ